MRSFILVAAALLVHIPLHANPTIPKPITIYTEDSAPTQFQNERGELDGSSIAVMRELPRGDRVWDDQESTIPQLVAVTAAHWGTLEFAEEDTPAALPSNGAENVETTSSHLDVLGASF